MSGLQFNDNEVTKFEMIHVFHEMHTYETLSMKMKQLQTKSTCSSPWYAKLASSFTKINLIIAWNHSLSERGGVGTLCIQGAGQGSARSGDTMDSIFFVAQLTLLINNGLIFSCYLVASQSFANRSWLLVVDKGITSQFDVCINWGLYLGMGDLKLQLHNSKKNACKYWEYMAVLEKGVAAHGDRWQSLLFRLFSQLLAASC